MVFSMFWIAKQESYCLPKNLAEPPGQLMLTWKLAAQWKVNLPIIKKMAAALFGPPRTALITGNLCPLVLKQV